MVDQGVAVEPKPDHGHKRYRTIAITCTALLLGGVIGAGSVLGYQKYDDSRSDGELIAVAGEMTLTSSTGWEHTANGCTGEGGYSDIHKGTNVVLKAASGAIVGVSNLLEGSASGGQCVFSWYMTGVNGDEQFYSMEIGRRGVLNYTREDLETPLTTALGGD